MKTPITTLIMLATLALNVFAQQEIPMFFDNEMGLNTNNTIRQVAYSPDGSKIATVFNNSKIAIWDAVSGREICRLAGHGNNPIHGIVFSPNGRQLASNSDRDSNIKIWDTSTGALIRNIPQSSAQSIAFSPDGNRIAVYFYGDDRGIKIWNTTNGTEIRTLQYALNSLIFSPDGRQILTTSNDRTIRIWDSGNGQTIRTINGEGRINRAAYSPNGRYIAAYIAGGSGIHIYNAETGQELISIPITLTSPFELVYSIDGRQLLVNESSDNSNFVLKIFDTETGRELRNLNHQGRVIAFSPDNRRILAASTSFGMEIEGRYYTVQYANFLDATTGRVTGTIGYGPLNVGARAYADLQIARFLGDTAAVNRHEAVLQFITGRGNATRAEIEAFYRNNIRGLIEEVVDREFAGRTVPASILTKVKAEFKKVLGDFYVTPTQATFGALVMEPIILEYRDHIIVGTGILENAALLGFNNQNSQDIRDVTNAINVARRQLMDITGEDFNPVNTDEYRYFRNGEFNYGNTQYYFRNILNSLNIDLDRMQETWNR